MSDIDDLFGRIRIIGTELKGAVRSESKNQSLAGWGQFVEAASQVYQIGPYGTSAGILVSQIAYPEDAINQKIKNQLYAFWNEKPKGKLFPQNVRLAFMVLSLARCEDTSLRTLRDDVANILRSRQHQDGSWSDALSRPGGATAGQIDATAWAVLALCRMGGSDSEAQRGANWLAKRTQGGGSIQLLSPIGVAAAVVGHSKASSVDGLREQAFAILDERAVSREELISFFDFDELSDDPPAQRRDYLCFPAFYPISLLINGLAKDASFFQALRLDGYRTDAVKRLNEIVLEGRPYKLPTANFASTVDQAILALTYEQLHEAEVGKSKPASFALPIYRRMQKSLIIRLVLPLVIVVAAVVTIKEPTTVPSALALIFGERINSLSKFAEVHKPGILIATAVFLAIFPGLPKSGLKMAKERISRFFK